MMRALRPRTKCPAPPGSPDCVRESQQHRDGTAAIGFVETSKNGSGSSNMQPQARRSYLPTAERRPPRLRGAGREARALRRAQPPEPPCARNLVHARRECQGAAGPSRRRAEALLRPCGRPCASPCFSVSPHRAQCRAAQRPGCRLPELSGLSSPSPDHANVVQSILSRSIPRSGSALLPANLSAVGPARPRAPGWAPSRKDEARSRPHCNRATGAPLHSATPPRAPLW